MQTKDRVILRKKRYRIIDRKRNKVVEDDFKSKNEAADKIKYMSVLSDYVNLNELKIEEYNNENN